MKDRHNYIEAAQEFRWRRHTPGMLTDAHVAAIESALFFAHAVSPIDITLIDETNRYMRSIIEYDLLGKIKEGAEITEALLGTPRSHPISATAQDEIQKSLLRRIAFLEAQISPPSEDARKALDAMDCAFKPTTKLKGAAYRDLVDSLTIDWVNIHEETIRAALQAKAGG